MGKVKESKFNSGSAISLNLEHLNEMLEIGVNTSCPYDLAALTYPQAQAVLTLFSLSKLLNTFGLDAPYTIDLAKLPTFDEEKDWTSPAKQSFGGRRARHK